MQHGGGMTWQPVTYDPELNLIYVDDRQPAAGHRAQQSRRRQPVHRRRSSRSIPTPGRWRGTSSRRRTIPTTGTRPRRRCCSTAEFNGQPRKLLAQAARNGHFFVLDRATGKALVSSEYVKTNWASGYDAKGQPIPNPAKHPQVDGALVSPDQGGATNWPPPQLQPADRPLLRQRRARAYSVYYLYDPYENPQGWGGTDRGGYSESMVQAIDYKTGKVKWSHKWEANIAGPACCQHGRQPAVRRRTVAATSSRSMRRPVTRSGTRGWARRSATVRSTYELDGTQYLLVGAGRHAVGVCHAARRTTARSRRAVRYVRGAR